MYEKTLQYFTMLIVLSLGCFSGTYSQPFIREIDTIPVIVRNDTIAQPFAGGIDGPNHRFVDIDGDGDQDLFIFDADLTVDFYRNIGTAQKPNFKLSVNEITLPMFTSWFLFADLNNDTKIDLITDNGGNSLSYYVNNGTQHHPDFVLEQSPVVDTSNNPIISGFLGIPAFADIDGDNDLDFFASNFDGTLTEYENIGTPGNPAFRYADGVFQNVAIVNDSCKKGEFTGKLSNTARHGGSIILFDDINDDGAKDLLLGDMNSRKIFFLPNNGSAQSPDFQCFDGYFPDEDWLQTSVYNEPTLTDIDNDNDLDLFIGGFINMGGSNLQRNSFWYYENTGTPISPNFQLMTKEFISTLDIGRQSHPVVVDVNKDEKNDLIIGNVNGQLWYYENTGTKTQPAFTMRDTLFAGIKGNFIYAPAVVDINGDHTPDLALGRFDGQVRFYKSIDSGNEYVFEAQPFDSMFTGLANVAPAFTDIDGDLDYDIFLGSANGRIRFYRNMGSSSTVLPSLVTSFFDSIDVGDDSNPLFFDIDTDGDDDLFIGNADGKLFYYEHIGGEFEYRTDDYAGINMIKESAPAFADIDSDGDPDLFMGTFKGGLHFYRNAAPDGVNNDFPLSRKPTEIHLFQNYPNPFNPITIISYTLTGRSYVSLKIFDVLGKEIAVLVQGMQDAGIKSYEWNAGNLPTGIYMYRLTAGNSTECKKMLFIR